MNIATIIIFVIIGFLLVKYGYLQYQGSCLEHCYLQTDYITLIVAVLIGVVVGIFVEQKINEIHVRTRTLAHKRANKNEQLLK